jgi:putative peptide zinc metalloprotease protein
MNGPLHSAQWFRVADLKPQLHAQAVHQRQLQRGQVWHVLTSPDGGRNFRLNATAWTWIARCDGQRTLDQLWSIVLAACGDAAPTQDECLDLLARLHQAGLLSFDRRPDFGHAGLRQAIESTAPAHRNTWLAWRIPLGRPQVWLDELVRLLPVRWGISAGVVMLLLLLWAALTILSNAQELAAHTQHVLASPRAWGLALLVYPLLKFAHECAHGWAARRYGVPVREWGVSLLMFMPVPYVDVSAASALPRRRQRLLVAGAGILIESAVAVVALAAWLALHPGPWRDLALLIAFLAGMASVMVNANPLLRFDGYHLLCDALNLPNLATRSNRHWQQWLVRALTRRGVPDAIVAAPGERPWLWLYAPAALLMRWAIAWAVVFWLGHLSHVLGWAAAAAFAWSLVVSPALQLVRAWRRGACQAGRPMPSDAPGAHLALQRAALAAPVVLILALAFWPLPVTTVAQGVIGLPESAWVRSQGAGLVEAVLVADGQTVQAGQAVLQLSSPTLNAEVERLGSLASELQAEYAQALHRDAAQAVQVEHRLQAVLAELAQNEERQAQLTVRAGAPGRIVIDRASDWPGRYVQRGVLIAHVLTGEPARVHVVVPHDRAAHLGQVLMPIEPPASTEQAGDANMRFAVRSADAAAPVQWARWVGKPSGGVTQLPSAALGDRSGGRIATDPADARGLSPSQPVLVGELQLDGPAPQRLGERVLVRFEHGRAPLLMQLAEQVQKHVLHRFNPTT